LFISSTLAIESITQIHIIAKALPTADVSAFSRADVLLINPSPHVACEYHVNILLGLSQSGHTTALIISLSQIVSLVV
jgi:hypothetical protein